MKLSNICKSPFWYLYQTVHFAKCGLLPILAPKGIVGPIRMPAISRRPELDDSSRSHSSPESTQALGSRIIPGPWNNNCCRLLSDTYLPEHPNGCRHAVAQWGAMAYPRQGGGQGWWHKPSVASKQMLAPPSTVTQSGPRPGIIWGVTTSQV